MFERPYSDATVIVHELFKDRGYSYDALGRLIQATGGSNGSLWTQSYSYDRYGNRTGVSSSGYSAKNESRSTGSAEVSSALSAQRERAVTEPRAVATGSSIAQPSEPKVDLPTEQLARNNSVKLPNNGKPLSDSPPT